MLDLLALVSADFQIGTYIIDPFGSQFYIHTYRKHWLLRCKGGGGGGGDGDEERDRI